MLEEAKEAVRKAREEWEKAKEKGAEIREKELLDCHHAEVLKEDDKMMKKKKKITSGIERVFD